MTPKCSFNPRRWLQTNMSFLALASSTLALNILMTLFNFYYVKVFLQRYHISSHWLSAAQLVYMICNFLVGPLIAYGLDYGLEYFRNRRRLIFLTGPLLSVAFMLPWFPMYETSDPEHALRHPWHSGVHLMVVLILWNVLFSIVASCNNGLFAEMSIDERSRVKALTFNQVAALIAAAAVFPVDALSKSVTEFRTFQMCCGVVAAVAAVCFVFAGMKASDVVAQTGGARTEVVTTTVVAEVAKVEEVVVVDKGTSTITTATSLEVIAQMDTSPSTATTTSNIKSYLIIVGQVLRTRNFWCAVISNFMTFFRVIVIYNFLAVYTEGLISEKYLPTGSVGIAAFYLVAQVSPRIVFIMASPLIRLIGSYVTLQATLVLACVNCIAGIFLGHFVGYNALAAFLILECILVTFQDLFVIFYSEVVDADVKTHKRKLPASTVIFAMTGLFIQPSTALAPMVVVRVLNIGQYDQYKNDVRASPDYTKQVMFLTCTCVPALAAMISFGTMCLYKREKKMPKRNPKEEMEKEDRVVIKL